MAICVDASNLAAKEDLSSIKAWVDELDAGILKAVSADLSKLSNAVDNNVFK